MKKVGVLALQGAVDAHFSHLQAIGVEPCTVKYVEDFLKIDALMIPGGESSTMLKLIERFELRNALNEFAQSKPIWGICAGAILMAKKVTNPEQDSFAYMDVEVQRNAYGRQLQSFQQSIKDYDVSFIRAPIITKLDEGVEVLASYKEAPVWIRQGRHMMSTFHPELNLATPSPFHKMFVESIL